MMTELSRIPVLVEKPVSAAAVTDVQQGSIGGHGCAMSLIRSANSSRPWTRAHAFFRNASKQVRASVSVACICRRRQHAETIRADIKPGQQRPLRRAGSLVAATAKLLQWFIGSYVLSIE